MGQVCQICEHKKRKEIERQIVLGGSKTRIARQFDVPEYSVRNHANNHINRQMATAWEMKQKEEGLNVLNELETLMQKTQDILDIAKEKKKHHLALSAIKELRGHLTLISQIQAFLIKQQKEDGADSSELRTETNAENLELLTEEELLTYYELQQKVMQGTTKRCTYINYDEPTTVETKSPEPKRYDKRTIKTRIKRTKYNSEKSDNEKNDDLDKNIFTCQPIEPQKIESSTQDRFKKI